ncbi:hypothetical protein RA210_U340011 [Rubrivivax sp. A210]|nr:hypothetical protein RA210_U280014 [Rubrivivax sp. A210]CAD5373553.1 hypothetical protein RA210_U340011 [Rubrivivax sp. A210]
MTAEDCSNDFLSISRGDETESWISVQKSLDLTSLISGAEPYSRGLSP